jgi:mRNA interferase RelE/StbE
MEIRYSDGALADLEKLPKRIADQIMRKITRLEHGLQGDIKRLHGDDAGYRLRSGDYRILFDVDGEKILIQKIGNRKDVYD